MKTTILILIVLLISGCAGSSPKPPLSDVGNDGPVYTITGKKDPRLDAWYLATYVSQSYTDECTSKSSFTGGKRYNIGGRSIQVQDGNYAIKLPIRVTGENNDCDYRFNGLELIMTRKYDGKLSSIHPVLSSRKKVNVVYWKTKGGAMNDQHPDTPPQSRNHQRVLPHSAREYVFV